MQIRNLLAAALLFSMSLAAVPALAATQGPTKKPTTTTLKASTNHLDLKQSGTLTVTVTPKTASGVAVVFYRRVSGGATDSYGTISISGGHGSALRKAWEVGKFSLWVVYEGSAKLQKSTSNPVTVTVTK